MNRTGFPAVWVVCFWVFIIISWEKYAICEQIALLRANQVAGIDVKMGVINGTICITCEIYMK